MLNSEGRNYITNNNNNDTRTHETMKILQIKLLPTRKLL